MASSRVSSIFFMIENLKNIDTFFRCVDYVNIYLRNTRVALNAPLVPFSHG